MARIITRGLPPLPPLDSLPQRRQKVRNILEPHIHTQAPLTSADNLFDGRFELIIWNESLGGARGTHTRRGHHLINILHVLHIYYIYSYTHCSRAHALFSALYSLCGGGGGLVARAHQLIHMIIIINVREGAAKGGIYGVEQVRCCCCARTSAWTDLWEITWNYAPEMAARAHGPRALPKMLAACIYILSRVLSI